MKTNSQIIAVTLCLLSLFSACKKKVVEVEVPQTRQIKLIKKVTRVQEGSQPVVINVSYDDQNRITEIANGLTKQTYAYTGNDMTTSTASNFTRTVTYTNGVPVSVDYGKGLIYNLTVENGHVVKTTSNAATPFIAQYLYTGNNLTTQISGTRTTKYVFGTKKNPFADVRLKYGFDIADLDYVSENEMTEKIEQDSPRLGSTYTYVFDTEGYPKTAVEKRTRPNDANSFVYTNITYEYEVKTVPK